MAEKLRYIRESLGLSQNEMLERLSLGETLERSRISIYETDQREPPLLVLLRYAKIANVYVDVLIDDTLDLPSQIPSFEKSAGNIVRGSG
ncbi:MAG: helix-turn-helix transcriptional regulator [Acidobacteria bacterium]|nr:helix-turn-helix transcriptional regulator [Acidobacteriota bacterium]